MVVEQDIQPFILWLFQAPFFGDARWGALWLFLFALVILFVLGLLLGFLRNLIQYGMHPFDALQKAVTGGTLGVGELFKMSPARLYAMSWLAFQESIRNWAVVGFVVFMLIVAMLGWYLDTETDHPAKLYLSVILPLSTILLIFLAIFLTVFSLPHDIEDRTIYTIVTKPVFSAEIVFGRVIGFGAVCTLLLLIMAVVSYFFVVQGLQHSHTVEAASVADVMKKTKDKDGKETQVKDGKRGKTTLDDHHRHEFKLDKDGNGFTDEVRQHTHTVREVSPGKFEVGPPEGMLQARVPVYGKLQFKGRDGKPVEKGINVGEVWSYRGYVEGGTGGAAIWTFPFRPDMFPEDRFPDSLPLEMNIKVFRTYKGDIERGILGSYMLKNPNPAVTIESNARTFTAKEFETLHLDIPRTIRGKGKDGKVTDLDIFADLAPDGLLELHVMCGERAQYFGMARADVYFRANEGDFWANFIKGYVSIWVMMMMVVSTGVMFSTFLNAPIALLATVSTLIFGFFRDFIIGVATGTLAGGGPIEALYRLLTQQNLVTPNDPGIWTSIMVGLDVPLRGALLLVAEALPGYKDFGTVDYVAYGFDIPLDLLLQRVVIGLGFIVVTSTIGYLFLRGREIAG